MAYVQQTDEEQQKQAQNPALMMNAQPSPMLSAGGSAPATSSAPSTSGATQESPKQTPGMGQSSGSAMNPQGSGFVNLSSFLTPAVAAQNQQKIKQTASGLGSAALGSFNTAADAARTGIANAAGPNTGNIQGLVDRVKGGNKDAYSQLAGMLSQSYTGPTGVDWDPSKNADFTRMQGLGGADTALDALDPTQKTQDGLLAAGRSQGNRWLDESLLKGDAGTLGAIGQAGADAKALGDKIGAASTDIAKSASDKAASIDKARDSVKTQLSDIAKGIIGRAQGQADTANATAGQSDSMAAGGKVWNPQTGSWSFVAPGQRIGAWEAGTGPATAGNFISAGDASGLQSLSTLLGDPSLAIQQSGPYASGRYTTEQDPNQIGQLGIKGDPSQGGVSYDPNVGQLQSRTHDPLNDFLRGITRR